jgi:RecA-family ATPase
MSGNDALLAWIDRPIQETHAARCAAIMRADLEIGPEAIDAAQAPEFVVEQVLPACGANLAGSGGTSKTTLTLVEATQIVGGGRLYGREVHKQAPCVLITAEDGARYARFVLQRLLADAVECGAISERHAQWAKLGIKFVAWPRATFGPVAHVDRDGNLTRSPVFDELLELLRPLNPAMVTLDPLALLGPGERFGNDADAFVAAMAHEAAQALGACVQFVDHVSQSVARGGIVDQYAARGGSAKTDNARLARQLVRLGKGEPQDTLPANVTPEDIERGRILQLHWTKSNYAPLAPMQWLRRRGYWIETLRATSFEEAQEARAVEHQRRRLADRERVVQAISEARTRGEYPTGRQLEDIGILDESGEPITRSRIRAALSAASAEGRLKLAPLPVELRQGARREYLEVRRSQ